jgi:hypothetical protein
MGWRDGLCDGAKMERAGERDGLYDDVIDRSANVGFSDDVIRVFGSGRGHRSEPS